MANNAWSNDAVNTLTVPTGATTGKRVVIINLATGDAIDIYNASNQLVFSIDNNGVATSFHYPQTYNASLGAGVLSVTSATADVGTMADQGVVLASDQSLLQLKQQPANGMQYVLSLLGGSQDATKKPTLQGTERSVIGSMVQTDQLSVNNLIHAAHYSITYAATGFTQVFNHGAAFTPAFAIVSFDDGSAINNAAVKIAASSITATQATLYTNYLPGLGSPTAGDTVIINAAFFA